MRVPIALTTAVTVLLAVPVGWLFGVFLAVLLSGKDFGQLPILTVPIGLVAAVAVAIRPSWKAEKRLAIIASSLALLVLFTWWF